jgi:hypothetical protein
MPDRNADSAQSSFAWAPAIVAFVFLESLVAVQALLAYRDHFLTVAQMRHQSIAQGLPFIWHFGMWGDALVVSGLAAYVVGRYLHQWRARTTMLFSLALGFASAAFFSWTYTLSGMPEAHVQSHRLTAVGVEHFFYMGIALAVFIQFCFFTTNISTQLLGAVSFLLLVHVFVGTHMVLGILNIVYPQAWYPAQPLRSIPGWTIVVSLALGLIWRNGGIVSTCTGITRVVITVARGIFVAAMYFIGEQPRSAEGYLRLLNYVCGFITFVFFFRLFESRWRHGDHLMSATLLVLVGARYYFSRLSVKQELAIAKTIFPLDHVPDELQPKDRARITFEVVGFLALYLFLGWTADYIVLASLSMCVISCIDFHTRKQINERVGRYFADPEYAPVPNERSYKAIQERRTTVTWFLFDLPHLPKEAACAAGCAVALAVAIYGYVKSSEQADVLAYMALMGTLVLNEIVTWWWRIRRDQRLKIL